MARSAFDVESFYPLRGQLYNRLDHLKERIRRPETKRRNKRTVDLLEGIGEIGASVFGLATIRDVKILAEVNERLAGAVDGVVNTQREVAAVVNTLGHQQEELEERMSAVIGAINNYKGIMRTLEGRLENITEQLELIRVVAMFNLLLDSIDSQVDFYQHALDQMTLTRTTCEARLVSETVVPLDTVELILAQTLNRVAIEPLAYYQYMSVKRITQIGDVTYCIVRAPMLNDEPHMMYHLNTFPVCSPTAAGCYRIYKDVTVVMGTMSETLYFPERCYGRHPLACQPGVVYAKDQQPCLHGLISGDVTQQELCPVTYTKTPDPAHPISTNILNRYVLRTDPTLYHYRCKGKSPFTSKLEQGTYIVALQAGCDMDAGLWLLKGLEERSFAVNVTIPPPQPVNLSGFDLNNYSQWPPIKLPPGINQLEFTNFKDVSKPQQTNLHDTVKHIQAKIGKRDFTWLWVIIGIVSVLGLILVAWKIYTYRTIRTLAISSATDDRVGLPSAIHYAAYKQSVDSVCPQTNQSPPSTSNIASSMASSVNPTPKQWSYGTQTENELSDTEQVSTT